MPHTRLYTILLSCLMIWSCSKKTNDPFEKESRSQCDTIFPFAYFPVYPGSNWEYVNIYGNKVNHSTGPAYIFDELSYPLYDPFDSMNCAYVPVYDHVPVWGIKSHVRLPGTNGDYVSTWRWHVRDGEINYYLGLILDIRVPKTWVSRIEARDVSMEVQGVLYDSVIITKECISYEKGVSFPTLFDTSSQYSMFYFARDIGIVKWDSFYNNQLVYKEELVSYYINK